MTKKVVKTEKRIDSVNYANTSIDGKSITVSDRFTIKVWNVETGSLIYTIINGKNGEYLTYTPEGFFTGTKWAMKNLVHIVDGMDVIGIDQVYDKLYRPDLVAAKMRGEDISEYAKEVNLASIVRSGNAPAVAIENLPELSDSRDVTFDVCVQNTGGGIGNVSIVLNGKTIQLSEGVASSKGEQKIFRHTVTLQNGQNKIEAFAMNSAGMIESRRASADVKWQGKNSKPNLYVLTVAVNKYRDKDLWLNYCVPDAASIEESFKKQQSGLYQNVCVYSLKDAEVTKEGLEQKFKELSSTVTADDVFVFFVSGHGTTYDDGDYYFIPVNFRYTNKTDIPLNAISKSDLTKNLSLIKAGKTLMMLDTCNSGSFFEDSNKRGMGDKGIFERLSRATGHAILAAASDSQSAMEGYNGHGVFTYVLLDGLAGNADSDGDGFVTLTELSSYVENQVPELSYEKWGYEQVPQKELRRQDFPIAEKLSE
ncbi:caspase family protein [Treponema succinifaciens]|uniref:caspase family protein n=1 Tax=Treponema succinifaciens TaxID=167 RepID=UPI0023F7DE10|nr:caspase family protein [Treponema succinifaciens]